MSQLIDTESAKEFMLETMEKISAQELASISADLAIKADFFAHYLKQESLAGLTKEELHRILRMVFSTRRKATQLLKTLELHQWKVAIGDLLYGKDQVQHRFERFYDQLQGVAITTRYDLAGELLHFSFPDQLWLCSKWMWNSNTQTGSLPLVVTEDYELDAPSIAETYLKVGKAITFVHHVGEAAGFQTIDRNLFGTDVYLCCVYVVYVYTVLRLRMTKEFNQVIPGLAEFSRRLLGIYNMEEYAR